MGAKEEIDTMLEIMEGNVPEKKDEEVKEEVKTVEVKVATPRSPF